jgi:hypothetical protein
VARDIAPSQSELIVDQSRASASGDVIGRDKLSVNIEQVVVQSPPACTVAILKQKLATEVGANQLVDTIIDDLARYYERRSTDGIDGLEAKLKHADRHGEVQYALDQKERFQKLLAYWGHFQSAQMIFALALCKVEYLFDQLVRPNIGILPEAKINEIVCDKIVLRIVDEIGVDVFHIDAGQAAGMVYWLAEQCFVRWHK